MKNRALIIVNVGGALVTLTIVAAVGWYAFADPETASSQLRELAGEVNRLNDDLMRLHAALEVQTSQQRKLLEAAEALGRLPSKSPIDRDLKQITALAGANGVKLLEVAPTSTVRYPNVLELRYRVKAVGTYQNQLRFLEDFEQCSFWADVTYLRIAQHSKGAGASPPQADSRTDSDPMRLSELTVSFFSAFQ